MREYHVVELNNLSDVAEQRERPRNENVRSAMRGVRFKRLIENYSLIARDNLFIECDEYNTKLNKLYDGVASISHKNAPCGEFLFDSVSTLGYDSLIIDQENAVVFIGQLLNWSREYFNWWVENSNVGFVKWNSIASFAADFGSSKVGSSGAILLNSPGYGIFGHWLIDFVPRMALSRLMLGADPATHLFGPLSDWMRDLITRAGISNIQAVGTELTSHIDLRLPSSTNAGYGFAEPINSLAWRTLSVSFNRLNISRDMLTAERLFVSRKQWQGTRTIDFHDQLENLMVERGFVVLHPEALSLAEQACMFAKARVIVGEDGSALHNIIFSAPGARLGVLMDPQRSNLWHAGICHLLGHHIAYAPLTRRLDEIAGDLSFVGRFVDQLCAP